MKDTEKATTEPAGRADLELVPPNKPPTPQTFSVAPPAKPRNFIPTARQHHFFQLAVSLPKEKYKRAIEKAQIKQQDIDKWFNNEDFCNWFHTASVTYMQNDLIAVYRALRARAISGAIPGIKLYLERFDKDYQAFLGKIDLAVRNASTPVSSEEMARAVVRELKTNPEFKEQLQKEMNLETEPSLSLTVDEEDGLPTQ